MKKTTFPGAVVILGLFLFFFLNHQSESFGLEEDLIITSSDEDVSCYNANNGIIDISVSGGSGNYSYQWTGPNSFSSSSEDLANLEAGTYTVSVSDDTGNTGTESIIISQPDELVLESFSSTSVSCFGGNDGSISAGTVSGGTAPYQYSLDGTNFSTATNFDSLAAGNYTLYVRDANSCSISTNIEIREPAQLSMNKPSSENVSCFGGNDGSIEAATVSGGTAPYQYSLDGTNFSTATNFDSLAAGNYTLYVRDANSCSISTNIEVTEPAQLSMTAPSSENVSCFGGNDGSITAGTVSGGTAPYQYSLDGTNFSTATNFDSLAAGNYTLYVRDVNNCSISTNIEITEPAQLSMNTPSSENVSCFGGNDGSITAGTVSGGTAPYQYSLDGTNFSTATEFDSLAAGNYTLYVRDVNNCSISTNIEITEPAQLSMNTPSSENVSCFGGNDGSITAGTVSGGTAPYQYSLDGTNFSTATEFDSLAAGNYTLYVRDANNCSISTNIEITEPAQLSMTAPSSENVSCFGGNDGSMTAGTVSGGTAPYQYSLDGTSFSTATNFDSLTAGNYTLYVRDVNNCSISTNIEITEPAQLSMNTPSSENVSCFGGNDGSISAGTVSGGTAPYQYSLDGTNFSTATEFNSLTAGNYTLYVQDANNCSISTNIEITEPAQLSMTTPSSENVSCFGGNDGSMTAGTVSGGTAPYQYSLDGTNFSTANNFDSLTAGNYTLYVRDSNNCSISTTIEITEPAQLSMTAPSSENVSCFGGNDGSISAGTVSGGTAPYQYSLDGTNFSTATNFDSLATGNYTLYVRDANNCSISTNIEITEPAQLSMNTPSSENVSCFGGNDGSISAGTVSGGTAPYQYSLDGTSFSTATNFDSLAAGNYTLYVRDANNCSISTNIEIREPNELIMEPPSSENVSCFGGSNGNITIERVSGGITPYQYSIDGTNYQSNKKFSNLSSGTYNVTVIDNNGCTTSQTIEITQPDDLIATNPSITNVNCYGASNGEITVGTINGGTAPYEYSIDNVNFQADKNFSNLSAGNYTLFIKDANACGIQQMFTIDQPDELISNYNKTNVNCYQADSGKIEFTGTSGGSEAFQYSIDNGITWLNSAIFENLKPSSYTLKIRDKNNSNCEKLIAENITITEPDAPVNATVNTTRTTVFGSKTGTAEAYPSGGTPGYTYEWRAAGNATVIATTKKATNLAAGNYELSVYDKNGCSTTVDVVVNEILKAEILPTSICEGENNVRVSYFEVADGTAYGGVGPYSYSWNFASDGTYTTDTGIGPHRVTYPSEGNRNITLTVTDAEGFSRDFIYQQYVGECYVDNCGSNDFGIAGYYIGDASGKEITSENCNDGDQKYIYVQLDQNTSRYSLYTEFTYSVKSLETGQTTINRQFGCFYEKEQIPVYAQTIPINYECGDEVSIDNIYLTFSNNIKNACGQSSKSKCFSTNNQEIVFTPLYAKATPNQLECYDSELGTIKVQASGGRAPYSYSITSASSGFQKENLFEILKAGSYDVWVKDSEATIFKISSVVITQPDAPITMEFDIQQPICPGDKATVTVNPSGGTPKVENGTSTYEYLWNDATGSTTKTLNNLEPGAYTITVIDANECQAIRTINITEPEKLTQAVTGEDKVLGCGYHQTTLEANTPEFGTGIWSVVSGPSDYNFIDPSDPSTKFIGNEGEYTLRWTVANENCSTYDDLHLTISANCNTLDFDGIDDHILIEDSFNMGDMTGFTLEAWIKSEDNTGLKTVISKRDVQNLNVGGYDLSINSGSPTFRWNDNSVSTSHQVKKGIWHHIAVIYQENTMKLYVDGILLANKSGSAPGNISAPFIIGGMYDSANQYLPSNYFDGWIEELRIWNKSLSEKQLRFLMNQRIAVASNPLRGNLLPVDVPGNLKWTDLEAYYQLKGNPEAITQGLTPEITGNHSNGLIRNITTTQDNTAPFPYVLSEENQNWIDQTTWLLGSTINNNTKVSERNVWQVPGSYGIDGETTIAWNIVEVSQNIFYPYATTTKPLQLLGLISNAGTLNIMGTNPPEGGTGNPLIITDYLKLNGIIDLNGESQLIQTEGSVLDPNSTGSIQKDQQGTANSYNYNYWSSPVSTNSINSGFTIGEVLKDGSDPDNIQEISFNRQYTWADSRNYTGPKRISSYWLNRFHQIASYSGWEQINQNTKLKAGEGYTMKGTSGSVAISTLQNYTFTGLPNNGDIKLGIEPNEIFLIGNPYPSALDAEQFILDNLDKNTVNGATGDKNLFNGAVYFWDHFGDSNSHYLKDYVGGYAALNLIGSVPAVSTDERINDNNSQSERKPGRYIPVGQGFFVNSYMNTANSDITISQGDILFRNAQRVFSKESVSTESQFLKPESVFMNTRKGRAQVKADEREKIRLNFRSPGGINRQIVVGADKNSTSGFDLGYDAPLYDRQKEDMFWLMENQSFVIQGVPDFNKDRTLDLGVIVTSNNEFYIEIDSLENISSEKEIYLLDRKDSTYFDLRAEKYIATIDSGYHKSRFAITFQKIENPDEEETDTEDPENEETGDNENEETGGDENEDTGEDTEDPEKPEVPEGIEEEENEEEEEITGNFEVFYLSKEQQVYLKNPQLIEIKRLLIYNINGSLIKEFNDVPIISAIYIPMEHKMSSAVYILKIFTEKGVTNLKFVRN